MNKKYRLAFKLYKQGKLKLKDIARRTGLDAFQLAPLLVGMGVRELKLCKRATPKIIAKLIKEYPAMCTEDLAVKYKLSCANNILWILRGAGIQIQHQGPKPSTEPGESARKVIAVYTRTQSAAETQRQCKCSRAWVNWVLNKYNITHNHEKGRPAFKPADPETIKNAYKHGGVSVKLLARSCGFNPATLLGWLNKNKVRRATGVNSYFSTEKLKLIQTLLREKAPVADISRDTGVNELAIRRLVHKLCKNYRPKRAGLRAFSERDLKFIARRHKKDSCAKIARALGRAYMTVHGKILALRGDKKHD